VVSKDVLSLLVTGRVGVGGTNIFIGREPTSPNNCLTIYDTGGPSQDARLALNESYFQLRSRHISYESGYEKLEEARRVLEGRRTNATVNNNIYIGFWVRSDIMFLMRDEQDRYCFTLNFRTIWHPPTANRGHREDLT